MNASTLVADVLRHSGTSKSVLAAKSGVSRSLIDEYLKGLRQPSVAQLDRLATSAGLALEISLTPQPVPVPPEFVAVLEFGDLFPRRERDPLVNIGPLWREIAERHRG